MIEELDETLLLLLRARSDEESLLREVDASFAMPDTDWRDKVTQLTLNCYLYDVRENRSLRTNEDVLARMPDGRVLRQPAPARIECTWCITAWTPKSDAAAKNSGAAIRLEHKLLGQALSVVLQHPHLEPSALLDTANQQHLPRYPTRVALADEERGMSEFWSALGQHPKPSLNVVLTMAVPLQAPTSAGPPVERVTVATNLSPNKTESS